MKAIIIAGGKGERLRPLTDEIPKPMIKVGGKPILEHTINLLKKNGVTSIILALCYKPQVIVDYFKDGKEFGVDIKYTFEKSTEPLGTAGAILPAKKLIDESFIVTYADTIRDLDVKKMISSHKKSNCIATINIYKHRGPNFKSMISYDQNNTLTRFDELGEVQDLKNDVSWSNGSFYIFEPKIFNYINIDRPTDFAKNVFPILLKDKEKINTFPSEGYFIDIGTFETLEQAEKDTNKSPI